MFKKSLDYLTEPAIVPTFPDDVLYTLCRHAPSHDVTLPISYYQTASPIISSGKVLETYFLVLCHAGITEAFYFSRSRGDPDHRVLFEKLITFVHAGSSGESKAARGLELVSLPLTDKEDRWFRDFLANENGNILNGAADTLTMRDITVVRPNADSNGRKARSSDKIDGLSWATLKDAGR